MQGTINPCSQFVAQYFFDGWIGLAGHPPSQGWLCYFLASNKKGGNQSGIRRQCLDSAGPGKYCNVHHQKI